MVALKWQKKEAFDAYPQAPGDVITLQTCNFHVAASWHWAKLPLGIRRKALILTQQI